MTHLSKTNRGTYEKRAQIDTINGSVLGKILLYAIPLMLSGGLQLLFNAADMVVGRYAGGNPFAAEVAFLHAAVTFVGQNVGAKKYRRIPWVVACCVLLRSLLVSISAAV